jgi:hypothetical protein
LLLPVFADNWRATFALCAAPIVAIAVLTFVLAPREGTATVRQVSERWWPDWPAWDVWPAWFDLRWRRPALFRHQRVIAFSRRIESRAWPFILASVVGLAGVGAIVVTASGLTVVSAAVVGFAAGAAFALGLTLPPLLSKPEEVARVAAAMFTISYASTVVVSLICGALWDFTTTARAAFLPIIIATLLPILLIPTIRFDRGSRVGV